MSGIEVPMIRPTTPRDRPAVVGLLADAGLPLEGVPSTMEGYVVAENHDGTIVGGAGLEAYGYQGLLRSVVVSPALRGTGVGRALTDYIISAARERGLKNLYLLTTTAENFFPRFGFHPITRDEVPQAVQASVEFQGACPATAIIMHRSVSS